MPYGGTSHSGETLRPDGGPPLRLPADDASAPTAQVAAASAPVSPDATVVTASASDAVQAKIERGCAEQLGAMEQEPPYYPAARSGSVSSGSEVVTLADLPAPGSLTQSLTSAEAQAPAEPAAAPKPQPRESASLVEDGSTGQGSPPPRSQKRKKASGDPIADAVAAAVAKATKAA